MSETESWAVTVERNGDPVVTLSNRDLSGRNLVDGDEVVIRRAAEHLLSFIASPAIPRPEEEQATRDRFAVGHGEVGADRTGGEAHFQPPPSAASRGPEPAVPSEQPAVKRYDLMTNYRAGSSIEEMEPSDDGEWVRFEDVAQQLAASRVSGVSAAPCTRCHGTGRIDAYFGDVDCECKARALGVSANLPPETLDEACHCGKTPEGAWVFGTACPVIAHRARAGKQWRDAYVRQWEASGVSAEGAQRQGCTCRCCDHHWGSDCACACHADGECAWQTAGASGVSEGWQPIAAADADTPVLLYTPRERLTDLPVHIAPEIRADIRVSAPRYWTWATHWMPLPAAPAVPDAAPQRGAEETTNDDDTRSDRHGLSERRE